MTLDATDFERAALQPREFVWKKASVPSELDCAAADDGRFERMGDFYAVLNVRRQLPIAPNPQLEALRARATQVLDTCVGQRSALGKAESAVAALESDPTNPFWRAETQYLAQTPTDLPKKVFRDATCTSRRVEKTLREVGFSERCIAEIGLNVDMGLSGRDASTIVIRGSQPARRAVALGIATGLAVPLVTINVSKMDCRADLIGRRFGLYGGGSGAVAQGIRAVESLHPVLFFDGMDDASKEAEIGLRHLWDCAHEDGEAFVDVCSDLPVDLRCAQFVYGFENRSSSKDARLANRLCGEPINLTMRRTTEAATPLLPAPPAPRLPSWGERFSAMVRGLGSILAKPFQWMANTLAAIGRLFGARRTIST